MNSVIQYYYFMKPVNIDDRGQLSAQNGNYIMKICLILLRFDNEFSDLVNRHKRKY